MKRVLIYLALLWSRHWRLPWYGWLILILLGLMIAGSVSSVYQP